MPKDNPRTKVAKEKYLALLGEGEGVTQAAARAGVCRRTPPNWRRSDPEFAEAEAEAHELGIERLEAEARRRALDGSDSLLMFMLRAKRPSVYRERFEVQQSVEMQLIEQAQRTRERLAQAALEDPALAAALETRAKAVVELDQVEAAEAQKAEPGFGPVEHGIALDTDALGFDEPTEDEAPQSE